MRKYFFLVFFCFNAPLFAAECLTVDFDNIGISEAFRIYSDMTKKNYALDNSIVGNVQLHLKCVSSESLLQSIIAVIGGGVVVEKLYRQSIWRSRLCFKKTD